MGCRLVEGLGFRIRVSALGIGLGRVSSSGSGAVEVRRSGLVGRDSPWVVRRVVEYYRGHNH